MYIRFHGTVISLSNVIVRVKSIFKVYEVLQDRIRRKFYEVILILVHRKAKIFFSVLSICRKNEVLRNFYISSVLSLILLLKKIVQSTGLVLNLLFFIYFVHVLHASDVHIPYSFRAKKNFRKPLVSNNVKINTKILVY